MLLLLLHCATRLHVFVDGAFGHVLHMVPLLYVKLAGKNSYVSLYVIAQDVIHALACCRLGCSVGSIGIHTNIIFWASVHCMVVTDTAPALPGLVWPRLAGGCPGGQARVAWGWFDSSSCLTVMLAQGYRTPRQHQDFGSSNL